MRALILAAGEGTRLRPLTLDRPKPMIPIAGVPLLERMILHLRRHGIDEIAINLHYQARVITNYFGDGQAFGVRITYSPEERLLGSAGAAKRLEQFFDDTFLVCYGDVLSNIDVTSLSEWHRSRAAVATIAVYEAEDPTRCGIVGFDADGRVGRFVEKPAPDQVFSRFANAGICVLEPRVLAYVPKDQPCDFGQHVFSALLRDDLPVYARPANAYVMDIGSIERLEAAERDLRAGRILGFRAGQNQADRAAVVHPSDPPCELAT